MPFISSPKLVSCTFIIAYSRAKLNRSGDKASPGFKPFSIGKLEDKYFPILTLLWVTPKHVLINLTSFFGTPHLIRISYRDSLFKSIKIIIIIKIIINYLCSWGCIERSGGDSIFETFARLCWRALNELVMQYSITGIQAKFRMLTYVKIPRVKGRIHLQNYISQVSNSPREWWY